MGIDDIQLNADTITSLYRNVLIDEEVSAGVLSSKEPVSAIYKFLGNNRKKIVFITNCPGTVFVPEEQLAFLIKMLDACKMNIGDIAIVNHAAAIIQVNLLKEQFQPEFILLFGLQPVQIDLPINFPRFKIQAYDQCTYLSIPALDELVAPGNNGKLLKSKLWLCLQTMFGV